MKFVVLSAKAEPTFRTILLEAIDQTLFARF